MGFIKVRSCASVNGIPQVEIGATRRKERLEGRKGDFY